MHHKTTGLTFVVILLVNSLSLRAQPSWFIDGYHGGVWGHYPRGYTSFIVQQLQGHPQWKINLEIEPVTWDAVKQDDPLAFLALQGYLADTSVQRRIEYVNPGYGQSYLFNISGESIIRQFAYGIKKLRQHFPHLRFETYSSEEPCFTSALPQLLRSFGFRYASLKNPNTCWGGYTRAFGGELVRWVGPDGSWLYTVPRYATEALEKNSTWQTIAWHNSVAYLDSALAAGVRHPVGMCLQDAGWRNGPWLGGDLSSSAGNDTKIPPPVYTTWQQYFSQVADTTLATDWKFSQEDVLVSLVWGAQALQRIAQQVRYAENKIVATEKLLALSALEKKTAWPQQAFDEAWQNLLLAQHHDCWIVPYNGPRGNTWIDKVQRWTKTTETICDSIIGTTVSSSAIRLINTTAINREELVSIPCPSPAKAVSDGRRLLSAQWVAGKLLFRAKVPSAGYSTYQISDQAVPYKGASVTQHNGLYILETDLYRMVVDAAAGGAIKSLQFHNRELVSGGHFNSLQGNFFYYDGLQNSNKNENAGKQSTQPATIVILENGPLRIQLQINTAIAGHPVQQTITLIQSEPRIDCQLQINWQHNTGIGNNYNQNGPWDAKEYKKAFYNDRDKLLLLFPVNLNNQIIHKNAPFDVTTSKLDNTFFTTWDSIKNNIILNWVDVTDKNEKYGMALFTDHTTAYTHDKNTLGLVIQYAGKGLWGRNYTVDGTTTIDYSLLPHTGNWEKAAIEGERVKLAEPLLVLTGAQPTWQNSFLQFNKKGWELSSMTIDGTDLVTRIYHAAGIDQTVRLFLHAPNTKITMEELNGRTVAELTPKKAGDQTIAVDLTAPRFGIRTIRFHNVIKN